MNKALQKQKLVKWLCSLLVLVGIVGILISSHSAAAEKRTVKVAFFPMQGYHFMDEDGDFAGMDVEYLEVLCEYTNWEIEYVKCKSWEEALRLLAEEEVDLVDDLDGTPADETLQFALDGRHYEIDLSAEHAKELRSTLKPYLRKYNPDASFEDFAAFYSNYSLEDVVARHADLVG